MEGPPLREKRPRPLADDQPLPIYLDHNATTPVSEAAWEAMVGCRDLMIWGNPSSSHDYGLHSKFYVDAARQSVADSVGAADPAQIIFTSGGTEANNIAILGTVLPRRRELGRDVVLTTSFEHDAVANVMRDLREHHGCSIVHCPLDPATGVLDIEAFDSLARRHYGQIALVSIMHANNEVGAIQPLAEVSKRLRKIAEDLRLPRVPFHIDAAQSIGKIPVNVDVLGADLLSICSHKFYGPKGVGALYRRTLDLELGTPTFGAGQEAGQRPGTENLVLIRGMAAALAEATRDLEKNVVKYRECRDLLLAELQRLGAPKSFDVRVNGSLEHALPNTLNVSIYHRPNDMYISGHRMIHALGNRLAMSAGAACHAVNGVEVVKSVSPSLRAVGVDEERAKGTLRLSTGHLVGKAEVARAAQLIMTASANQMPET